MYTAIAKLVEQLLQMNGENSITITPLSSDFIIKITTNNIEILFYSYPAMNIHCFVVRKDTEYINTVKSIDEVLEVLTHDK